MTLVVNTLLIDGNSKLEMSRATLSLKDLDWIKRRQECPWNKTSMRKKIRQKRRSSSRTLKIWNHWLQAGEGIKHDASHPERV